MTDGAWGLSFPAWSPASEGQFRAGLLDHPSHASLPVHATQLYEAAGCFVLAMLLWRLVYPRRRYDGQVSLAFLAGYAVLRFVLEFWRDDDRGGFIGLSTSQWIGVAIIGVVWAASKKLAERFPLPESTQTTG